MTEGKREKGKDESVDDAALREALSAALKIVGDALAARPRFQGQEIEVAISAIAVATREDAAAGAFVEADTWSGTLARAHCPSCFAGQIGFSWLSRLSSALDGMALGDHAEEDAPAEARMN